MKRKYDFGGYATRNDLRCSDGRTIRHNAFKDCDGSRVPLVWNHCHKELSNVLPIAIISPVAFIFVPKSLSPDSNLSKGHLGIFVTT